MLCRVVLFNFCVLSFGFVCFGVVGCELFLFCYWYDLVWCVWLILLVWIALFRRFGLIVWITRLFVLGLLVVGFAFVLLFWGFAGWLLWIWWFGELWVFVELGFDYFVWVVLFVFTLRLIVVIVYWFGCVFRVDILSLVCHFD